ncbi:hypothetical protein JX265_006082 [Neoarthrinium moseri]|uniref:Uncharacterized protein n=1 Tax=Neoarthrinium moseri TaxID=1658444 RepID=A0A9P9WMY9_9PEZI|nr:hypothetical protein JX266_000543 [Neoarthrinium moseri]KAI1871042.1 hypothetical protein JX265_006082 [Neoarthrinium moseri]
MTEAAVVWRQKQVNSLLFLLPAKFRHRIYEFCLSFANDDFSDSLRPTHVFIESDPPPTVPAPQSDIVDHLTWTGYRRSRGQPLG